MKWPLLFAAALSISACSPNRTELGAHYPPASKSADEPWRMVASGGVPPFDDAAMAFDADRSQLVLFGGQSPDDANVLSDATWLWDGLRWSRATPAMHPSARSGHKMIFDQYRGRVLLVGGMGESGKSLVDTWEWDGATWTPVDGDERSWPAPSEGEVWLYDDAVRESPVLIGSTGTRQWSLQQRAWVSIKDEQGPSTLIFSIASDPIRRVAVAQVLDSTYGSSTMESTGAGWHRVVTQNYPGKKLVFDAARRQMVMLVATGSGHLTLERSDGLWVETSATGPGDLTHSAIAYDSARGKVVLLEAMLQDGAFHSETWER